MVPPRYAAIKSLARCYATIAKDKDIKNKKNFLTLEHFLQRGRALALWRDITRAIHQVPPSATRDEMRTFARGEFERNKFVYDISHIRYLISTGKTQFDSMKRYIDQNVL